MRRERERERERERGREREKRKRSKTANHMELGRHQERLSDDKNGGIFIAAINAATVSSCVVTKCISLRFTFALLIISVSVLLRPKNLLCRVKSRIDSRNLDLFGCFAIERQDKRGSI